MNCRRARKLMHDLLDGALPEAGPLTAHLDVCPACHGALATMRRACQAASECPPPADEEATLDRLTARVLADLAAPTSRPRPGRRAWVPAAAVAGMLLAFLLGRGLGLREASRAEPAAQLALAQKAVATPAGTAPERVITREVPVYRTHVVYRDRVVRKVVRVPVVRTRTVIRYVSQPPKGVARQGPRAGAPPPRLTVERLPSPQARPDVGYSESVLLASVATKHTER